MSKKKASEEKFNQEVWIVVLAAGYSRRLGQQKLLLPFGGKTLIRFLVTRLLAASADGIVIVTNSEYPKVKQEVNDLPVVVLENNQSYQGMSSSLKMGIQYLHQRNVGAALIVLGDQPFICLQTIDLLIKEYKENTYSILQPIYKTKPSHPVLFSFQWFPEILKLEGDQGAKTLLKNNQDKVTLVKVHSEAPRDFDHMREYVEIVQWGKEHKFF
ncbi:nucleotidyltransferase family protein [Mesobacillus maritimus]|uniref:Nucleotidyltransferase family protein n=1 Tax=Mesobacillus maritimus TaxID=1643336 RepID=A0ABS7KAU3_9BACI|nr:nucleotidyltransferase family protein [Mesobacillus maritimus]MBY0099387.1 nucleotidyltransferase family protein [Mesobacillus maritimus]